MQKEEVLKLENQMCFPLYACSKEVIRRYKPYLDPLDLTYTQFITLMALWERGDATVKMLGDWLYLDSGTLTPLLKKLETKGYITRSRSHQDERSVIISLTEAGHALREKAEQVPHKLRACVRLAPEEAMQLHGLLKKLLGILQETD